MSEEQRSIFDGIKGREIEYETLTVPRDRVIADGSLEPQPGFVESIREYGILVPPVVRKARTRGKFVVVDGRRRLRAAEMIGLDQIEVRVLTGVGEVIGNVLTLQTNAQRSANTVAELKAMEALIAKGASERDLVQATGLKVQTVRSRLKLLNLTPTLREAWESGKMPFAAAESAAGLDLAKQGRLEKIYEERGRVRSDDVASVRKVSATETVSKLDEDIFGEGDVRVWTWADRVASLLSEAVKLTPGDEDDLRDRLVALLKYLETKTTKQ